MIGRVIGLLILCFLVGLILETLGITAQGIVYDMWNTIRNLGSVGTAFVTWALPYTLLGAVIVVPLALLGIVRRRRWRQ